MDDPTKLRTFRSPAMLLSIWSAQVSRAEAKAWSCGVKPNATTRLQRRMLDQLRAVVSPFNDTPASDQWDPIDRDSYTHWVTVPSASGNPANGGEGPPTEAVDASIRLFLDEVARIEKKHHDQVTNYLAGLHLADQHRAQDLGFAHRRHMDRCYGRERCTLCHGLLPCRRVTTGDGGHPPCDRCGGDRLRGVYF